MDTLELLQLNILWKIVQVRFILQTMLFKRCFQTMGNIKKVIKLAMINCNPIYKKIIK